MSKWEMVKLGEVLDYEQPQKYLVESEYYNNSYNIPVLTAGKTFILGYTNEQNNIFTNTPVIIFDDFTTAIKYVDFQFKVKSSAMKILKSCDISKAHIKYIYYQMLNISTDTQLHKRYWISTYANIQIPLPPLDVQKKIADELDKINLLITKRKEQLEKLDLLVKAKFVEMFGSMQNNAKYPYCKVQELAKVISGGTPSRDNPTYWNGDIFWVKTTELKNKSIFNTKEQITQEGLSSSSAKLCPPNTILIAMYGQGKTRGMTALLKCEASTNQACACILPSDLYNTHYLWHYLILSYDELRGLAKGGNQPNLNGNMIKEYKVLSPPLTLQNEFADYVEKVEALKQKMQTGLNALEMLYKERMQEYFG